MGLPVLGTYTSADGVQKIEISTRNSTKGSLTGKYESKFTPVGLIEGNLNSGQFNWVKNHDGGNGSAPFLIRFTSFERPSGSGYCISDIWSGIYQKDNTMLLTGARVYADGSSKSESISLGTKTFSM